MRQTAHYTIKRVFSGTRGKASQHEFSMPSPPSHEGPSGPTIRRDVENIDGHRAIDVDCDMAEDTLIEIGRCPLADHGEASREGLLNSDAAIKCKVSASCPTYEFPWSPVPAT